MIILPPPQWLTGNLKLSSQGKIGNAMNTTNGNSKRRITDWKSVGIANNNIATAYKHIERSNDSVLPRCKPKNLTTIAQKRSYHLY